LSAIMSLVLDYRRRFHGYCEWDRELREHTRFFAAAAVICDVLAASQRAAVRCPVAVETRRFLAGLSSDLEAFNQRIALEVRRRALESPLDERIVHLEQTRVQGWLDRIAAERARDSERIVGALNRMLNAPRCWWAVGLHTSRLFRRSLYMTGERLGRPIDFARQADRERIGNSLIIAVRADAARKWAVRPFSGP
jgi:hypothetical protein